MFHEVVAFSFGHCEKGSRQTSVPVRRVWQKKIRIWQGHFRDRILAKPHLARIVFLVFWSSVCVLVCVCVGKRGGGRVSVCVWCVLCWVSSIVCVVCVVFMCLQDFW